MPKPPPKVNQPCHGCGEPAPVGDAAYDWCQDTYPTVGWLCPTCTPKKGCLCDDSTSLQEELQAVRLDMIQQNVRDAIAAEREACARLVERSNAIYKSTVAAAIRARGKPGCTPSPSQD